MAAEYGKAFVDLIFVKMLRNDIVGRTNPRTLWGYRIVCIQCHLAEWVSTLVPRWRGYSWTASIGGHKCNVSKVIRVVQCYVIVLLYELYNAADRVHHPRAAWSRVSVTPSG